MHINSDPLFRKRDSDFSLPELDETVPGQSVFKENVEELP